MTTTTPRGLPIIPNINVTPLVDVLLVLLIIFMVVVPSASRGLDAALPAKPSGPIDTDISKPLVITVDRTGFALNRQPMLTLHDLEARLAEALSGRADRTVFVQADGAVSYGGVVEVMDAAVGAGADRIGIMDNSP